MIPSSCHRRVWHASEHSLKPHPRTEKGRKGLLFWLKLSWSVDTDSTRQPWDEITFQQPGGRSRGTTLEVASGEKPPQLPCPSTAATSRTTRQSHRSLVATSNCNLRFSDLVKIRSEKKDISKADLRSSSSLWPKTQCFWWKIAKSTISLTKMKSILSLVLIYFVLSLFLICGEFFFNFI